MSRRIVAPVLLLLAAALSIAAVFVVHDIESAGGPLSEPSAIPPYFSPNGDGIQDEVEISFTTKRAERVTVRIVDEAGKVVHTLLDDERIDGEHTVTWNGVGGGARTIPMPDGVYRALITREGDRRSYEPTVPIVIDTRSPRGRLDRATLDDGTLRGLALLADGEKLVVTIADGTELDDVRTFQPRDLDAFSAQPKGPHPVGTLPVRFVVSVGDAAEADDFRFFSHDLAGNRRELRGWTISVTWVTP